MIFNSSLVAVPETPDAAVQKEADKGIDGEDGERDRKRLKQEEMNHIGGETDKKHVILYFFRFFTS